MGELFGGVVRDHVEVYQAFGDRDTTPEQSVENMKRVLAQTGSCLPNPGPYQSFKGTNPRIPVRSDTSSLQAEHGRLTIPTGPGFGIEIDPDFVAAAGRV